LSKLRANASGDSGSRRPGFGSLEDDLPHPLASGCDK